MPDDTTIKPTVQEVPPPVSPPAGGGGIGGAPIAPPSAIGDNTFGVNASTPEIPTVVTTPTPPGGISGGGGFFSKKTLFLLSGLLLLVGAVGAGILLVQQQQELREKAEGCELVNVQSGGSCGGCGESTTTSSGGGLRCCSGVWQADTGSCAAPGGTGGATCPNDSRTIQKYVKFTCPNGCVQTTEGGITAWRCYENRQDSTSPLSLNGACGQVDALAGPNDSDYCGYSEYTCGEARCQTGGTGTVPPTATPDTRSICGGSCTTDTDCKDATYPGIDVVCRAGTCVNQQCYDRGGTTKPGTLCECNKAAGLCGDSCGLAIGLCQSGYSCTYLAQSQCSPNTQYPVCVPPGSETGQRGPMTGVPQYQDASFERRRCGGTADPENNYIYHPTFPTGMTQQQVKDLICNPTPPTAASAQCLNILVYTSDDNWVTWTPVTDLTTLKPGNTIRVTVAGSATQGAFDQARFTFNGTLRNPVTQKKPGTQEFYDEITIPATATSIEIKGELHHPDLQWF